MTPYVFLTLWLFVGFLFALRRWDKRSTAITPAQIEEFNNPKKLNLFERLNVRTGIEGWNANLKAGVRKCFWFTRDGTNDSKRLIPHLLKQYEDAGWTVTVAKLQNNNSEYSEKYEFTFSVPEPREDVRVEPDALEQQFENLERKEKYSESKIR